MRRFAPVLLAATLAALLTAPAASVRAQQNNVTVPSSLANIEGNGNNSYPFNIYPVLVPSMRYQQIYAASEFGTRRLLITDIEFRPDALQGLNFLGFVDNVQINLSTTSATVDNLSSSFAANIGLNDTIVYNPSNLTLSSQYNGLGSGPANFDVSIRLTTPFVYEPTQGRLLLDVRTFASTTDTTIFDAVNTTGDSVSRVYALNVGAASGTRDSLGLVTRFKAIQISTLAGRIDLEEAFTNLGIPIIFEFRRNDNNTRFTRTVFPNNAGNFQINNLPSANYEVGVKGHRWLRKTVDVDLTSGDSSGFNYTLKGGDGNDDNVVDVSDLILIINHYNQKKNTPLNNSNFLEAVDFNNDDVNDVGDLLIVIHNYNKLGDP